MTVNRSLLNLMKQDEFERQIMKPVLLAMAKHVVGKNEGETPAASPIGRHFTKSNQARYEFAPLSPKYAAWKKKKVGNKPILVLTGAWKKSAAYQNTIKATGNKVSVKPSNPPAYAKYLEHGTKKMPARPAYTLNEEDRGRLNDYLKKLVHDLVGDMVQIGVSTKEKVV